MSIKNLLGTAKDQVPRNSDLGGLAYQDENNVYFKNATIENTTITGELGTPYLSNDVYPTVPKTLSVDFVRSKVADSRFVNHRNSIATYVDSSGHVATAKPFENRVSFKDNNCQGLLLEEESTNLQAYSQNFEQWSSINTDIIEYSTSAPDTTLTAHKFVATASSGSHRIKSADPILVADGQTLTASIYAKAGERKNIRIGVWDHLVGQNGFFVVFDLIAGQQTVDVNNTTNVGGSGVYISSSHEKLSDGWYRISVTGYIPTVTEVGVWVNVYSDSGERVWVGDNTGLYIWGAQLEKKPYATSYIPPSYKRTFAELRTQDAVFGGSAVNDGLTEGNLLSAAETVSVHQMRTYKITENLDLAAQRNLRWYYYTNDIDRKYYYTIYIKPINCTVFRLYQDLGTSAYGRSWVDYDTTTVTATASADSGVDLPVGTISAVNDTGWFKLTMSCVVGNPNEFVQTNPDNNNRYIRTILYMAPDNTYEPNAAYDGRGVDSVYTTQLYFRDYNANSIGSPEAIGNQTEWTSSANTTVTLNSAVAPNGTLTASYFMATSSLVNAAASLTPLYSSNATKPSEFTIGYGVIVVYAKTAGVRYLHLSNSWFDLVEGTCSIDPNSITYLYDEGSCVMESVGDGWYKCVSYVWLRHDQTQPIGISDTLYTAEFTGTNSGVYLWGNRMYMTEHCIKGKTQEYILSTLNTFQNAYKPTYSSEMTDYTSFKSYDAVRKADYVTMNPTWYNEKNSTLIVHSNYIEQSTIVQLNDYITVKTNQSKVVVDGIDLALGSKQGYSEQTNQKFAISFGEDNSWNLCADGCEPLNITASPTSYTTSQIVLGEYNKTGYIKTISYYPSKVSDAELQELSKK